MSTEIDARGLACPQPVIATKKALDAMAAGVVTTVVDNAAARENVVKLATAAGCGVSVEERAGHYYIRITKGDAAPTAAPAGPATHEAPAGGAVYLIGRDTLGHGSDELGAVLVKSRTSRRVKDREASWRFCTSSRFFWLESSIWA